jgi:hypothetical protein
MASCREWCEIVRVSEKCFFHVYSSVATKPFTEPELLELLTRSREANSKLGLSGMLLYKHGDFLQVLEGPEQVVRKMIRKIRLDPRHQSMLKLLEGDYAERQFPYWHMGFRNLDTAEASKHARLYGIPQHAIVCRSGGRSDGLPAIAAPLQGARTVSAVIAGALLA